MHYNTYPVILNMKKNSNTIFVIDDERDVLDSLKWLLESVGHHVKTFDDPEIFLKNYPSSAQGCIILDMRMPTMSGLELQDQLNKIKNVMPIIFMTGHGDIPMAVEAMKLGALDFLTKPVNHEIVLKIVDKALGHCQAIVKHNQDIKKTLDQYQQLTAREKEILMHVGRGKLNKIIAYDLGISVRTVEVHRSNIMQKMNIITVPELIHVGMVLSEMLKEQSCVEN